MKIIFVTREGHSLPGARIRSYNFSKELSKYGIPTEVLSFSDSLGAKDGQHESEMGFKEKIKYNYLAFKRINEDRESFLFLQRVNYHFLAPYLAHLLKGNRIILDLDDWEMRENPKYYFGFYPSSKAHYFTRQIAKRSIFCIAASRFLENFLKQFNKRVYYIPSGVDTELFKPCAINLDKKRIVFSWIGTFHRKEYIENIAFALECFNSLRKKYSYIYFEILGDGIYIEDLEKIIRGYNDQNILLKSWIEPDKVPEYLVNIDIGLLPVKRSTKFNQAKSPTKLFEYMAMGKPTVANIIGEAASIIQDGSNGMLANEKKEFIDKMELLIKNSDFRLQIGKEARRCIEQKYSLRVLSGKLYKIINEC